MCTAVLQDYNIKRNNIFKTYKFLTMVYQYNYHTSGHYASSCLLLKIQLNPRKPAPQKTSIKRRKQTTQKKLAN
jgi:hypothetical protein